MQVTPAHEQACCGLGEGAAIGGLGESAAGGEGSGGSAMHAGVPVVAQPQCFPCEPAAGNGGQESDVALCDAGPCLGHKHAWMMPRRTDHK